MMKSKSGHRDVTLDALRGIGIFSVVWVHATWLCMGADVCNMWGYANVYPLPLFFGVSAFLLSCRHYTKDHLLSRWLKMLCYLIGGSVVYAAVFGRRVWDMFSNDYYYWFFAALLVMEVSWSALGRLRRSNGWLAIGGALGVWGLFAAGHYWLGYNFAGIPFADLEYYWPAYIFGGIMGYSGRLFRLVMQRWCAITGLVMLGVALFTDPSLGLPRYYLGSLGGLVFTWYTLRRVASSSWLLNKMAGLGRETLGIFLLSYFLLKLLSPIGNQLPREWVNDAVLQWILAFVIAVPSVSLMWYICRYWHVVTDKIEQICRRSKETKDKNNP